MGWTVKQAAQLTNLSADTLRYYDRAGILSPKRSEGGYRIYDDSDISSLKYIAVMKYAQFSLDEIKTVEALYNSKPSSHCNAICNDILTGKISALRQTIDNYQSIVTLIEELLPMIDCADAYRENAERIDRFIGRIFHNIQHSSGPSQPVSNRNEES